MKKFILFLMAIALIAGCTDSVLEDTQDDLMLKKASKSAVINVPGDFATIQEAVDNAKDGSQILIDEGIYEEQVVIDGKGLTLKGESGAIIKSPSTLPHGASSATSTYHAVISVENCNVTIDGLVVDGDGMGNSNARFVGILYLNAGGKINNCVIKDVRNEPLSGAQHGLGIFVYNMEDDMQEIFITNNEVYGFQKNGITVSGNWENDYYSANPQIPTSSNIKAHVNGNSITGAGPVGVPLAAQNGIQISLGASGEVKSNTISDLTYVPDTWASTGILDYYSSGVLIQGNTIIDCDPSLYVAASNGSKVVKNEFLTNGSLAYPWALLMSGMDLKVVNNSFSNFYVGIYVGSSYYGETTNSKLITNSFTDTEYTIYYSGESGDFKEHATKVYND